MPTTAVNPAKAAECQTGDWLSPTVATVARNTQSSRAPQNSVALSMTSTPLRLDVTAATKPEMAKASAAQRATLVAMSGMKAAKPTRPTSANNRIT